MKTSILSFLFWLASPNALSVEQLAIVGLIGLGFILFVAGSK